MAVSSCVLPPTTSHRHSSARMDPHYHLYLSSNNLCFGQLHVADDDHEPHTPLDEHPPSPVYYDPIVEYSTGIHPLQHPDISYDPASTLPVQFDWYTLTVVRIAYHLVC